MTKELKAQQFINDNEIQKLSYIQKTTLQNILIAWVNNEDVGIRVKALHKNTSGKMSIDWIIKYKFKFIVETWTTRYAPEKVDLQVLILNTNNNTIRYIWLDTADIAYWINKKEV